MQRNQTGISKRISQCCLAAWLCKMYHWSPILALWYELNHFRLQPNGSSNKIDQQAKLGTRSHYKNHKAQYLQLQTQKWNQHITITNIIKTQYSFEHVKILAGIGKVGQCWPTLDFSNHPYWVDCQLDHQHCNPWNRLRCWLRITNVKLLSINPPIHPSTYLSFGYTFQGSFQSHQNQITLMVIQTFNSDEGGVLMLGIFFSSYK